MNSKKLCLKCKDDFVGMDPPIKYESVPIPGPDSGVPRYTVKQFSMQYNGFGSKVKIINVKFKKLTAELEWKQTFLHSPFHYGFRAVREKYRFSLQRANKGRTFLEQANTARATPSDPQRINYFAVLFADLFKLLIGKCGNSSDKRLKSVSAILYEKNEEDLNYL